MSDAILVSFSSLSDHIESHVTRCTELHHVILTSLELASDRRAGNCRVKRNILLIELYVKHNLESTCIIVASVVSLDCS